MKKLKCYVVDDEPGAISTLQYLLTEYCAEKAEWMGSSTYFEDAASFLSRNSPDILLLDIKLGSQSGFDLLKTIEKHTHTHVIMVTAYNQYALEAFKYSAVNYLLKPVGPDDIITAIDRIYDLQETAPIAPVAHLLKTQTDRIFVPDRTGWSTLPIKDIVYIKGEGSYSHVITEREPAIIVSRNLRFFEGHLAVHEIFQRVQKSYIVNTQHIRRFLRQDGGVLEMTNGALIPVSAQQKNDLMAYLGLL